MPEIAVTDQLFQPEQLCRQAFATSLQLGMYTVDANIFTVMNFSNRCIEKIFRSINFRYLESCIEYLNFRKLNFMSYQP